MPTLLVAVSWLSLSACVSVPVEDPRRARAEAHERVGSWSEAAALWSQIYLDSGFRDLDAGRQAASASLVAGRPADARARLDDLLARRPGDAGLLELRGIAYEDLGLPAAARADYEAALAADPARPRALSRLGDLEVQAGEVDRGLERLAAGVALDPTDRGAQLRLGLQLARSGRPDPAAGAFQAAFADDEVSPRVPLEARLEAARLLPGDPRCAPWLEPLVRARPQHTEALWRLGQCEFAAGRRAAGLRHLTQAAESDPGDVAALAAFAAALSLAGRSEEAAAVVEHARGLGLTPAEQALIDGVAPAPGGPSGAGAGTGEEGAGGDSPEVEAGSEGAAAGAAEGRRAGRGVSPRR